jgi:hypothetical protein
MGVLNYLRRVTRKANKAPTMAAENAEQLAAMRAKYEVQGKYGRSAQSRVANVLRPQEGPHNIVAKEQRALAEKYKREYLRRVQRITTTEKIGLLQFAKKLRLKVKQHVKMGGGQNGNGGILIEIPMSIVKILLFAIGIALFILSLGVAIADTLFLGNAGLGTPVLMASYSLMGLGGREDYNDDDY